MFERAKNVELDPTSGHWIVEWIDYAKWSQYANKLDKNNDVMTLSN